MALPSLSIIIASLNRAAFLERTLLSTLRQDYSGQVETIVADGGSTDGTVEILKRYPQVNWWSRKDGGVADAMRQGLAAATGQVLAFQSSDDYYLPGAFARSVAALQEDAGIDLVCGTEVFLEPDGRTFTCSRLESDEITPRSLLLRRMIPMHCCFFRRSILDSTGGLRDFSAIRRDTGGNVGNVGIEIDLWYRALHFHRGRFIPWHTAVYQLHDGQMTRNSRHWYANMTAMVESCEQDPRYACRFKLSADEKRIAYLRWELLQGRLNGNAAAVDRIVHELLADPVEDSREFLALHGFVPKPPKDPDAPRHPNHRIPELGWYARAAA